MNPAPEIRLAKEESGRTPLQRAQKRHGLLVLSLGCVWSVNAKAQDSAEVVVVDKHTLQQMLQRIDELESRVNHLEAEKAESSGTVIPLTDSSEGPTLSTRSSHLVAETRPTPDPDPLDSERMDVGRTLLRIRGFGDFGLYTTNQRRGSAAFGMGELNLFVTSDLSDKAKFLSELIFENESSPTIVSNDFKVDVERALLQYSFDDHLKISMGLDHTAIGYYNTAYHHSAWMQTALDRPFLFSFEDRGGILPIRQA